MADVVVNLPVSPEEKLCRILVEAERLSKQPSTEWQFWLNTTDIAERLGTTKDFLKTAILGLIKEREKKATEERRIEERSKKEAERKAEQDAKRKAKERAKAVADITKLPRDQRDDKIAEMAESFDEEVEALQKECAEAIESSVPAEWSVEAWGEPVATAALLQELVTKINKHAIVQPYQALAIALWIMLAWVHEVAANFSPNLLITAPDIDSGKSTLGLDVVGKLVPRPFSVGEPTAAVIFRTADEHKPTCICDDVDLLFQRKPDLASIFNVSWKRGAKIPRMQHGITRFFDPFCPKVCTMVGTNIPRPLFSRCILIKMKPKKSTETIVEALIDDDEFKALRRKLKRWSDDNASGLKDAPPATDFSNNRERNNWNLQLAIAAQAGDQWRRQALQAAELLTRTMRKSSWLQLLLAEFRVAFKNRKWVTSEEFYRTRITANKLGDWYGYNHGTGVITQRQIAHLLKDLDIRPIAVGPKRLQGWRAADFVDAFERYRLETPEDPLIPSDGKKRSCLKKNKKRSRGKSRKRG
jgi:Protein of unknown function (DUF3631)